MSNGQLDTLDSLLRGELAATETYQQALEKITDREEGSYELRQMHVEHREAANALRLCICDKGVEPEHESGTWGTFAKAVEGAAKVFGNRAALKALKEGEEHGIHSYQNALHDDLVPSECQTLIRTKLLPQTKAHVAALDRLIEMR